MARRRDGKDSKANDRSGAEDTALYRGLEAINRQSAAEAEHIARDILARRPQDRGALHLLGRSLLMQKRAGDALAPLEQAARGCNDPIVETHYALALRDTGQRSEALRWLQQAASREPPFAGAYHELGILLCAMRRYDEAEVALKKAVQLQPSEAEHSVELGGTHICRADPAQAKVAFARALACAPGHVRALHGFGTALLFEGDFERAAERFRQVLARSPDHLRARLDLAHCLLELGRYAEGLDVLRAVVRATPQHYGKALKLLVSSGRGRFWLRPSAAADVLQLGGAPSVPVSQVR